MGVLFTDRRTARCPARALGCLASALGLVLVAAPACAPPCAGELQPFSLEGDPEGPDTVRSAAVVDDELWVEADDADGFWLQLRFTLVPGAAPALPAPGDAFLVEQGVCFGEGCDPAAWSVDGFFIAGTFNTLDDRDGGWPQVGLAPVWPAPAEAACDSGDGDAVALEVSTDEGPVLLAPGGSVEVRRDGARWQVLAGRGARTTSFHWPVPCADCAGPGPHSDTRIDAVAYRVAE